MKPIFTRIFSALAVMTAMSASIDAGACVDEKASITPWNSFHFIEAPVGTEKHTANGDSETIDFWYDYCGGKVLKEDVREFLYNTTADALVRRVTTDNFSKYLMDNGKSDAVGFLLVCLRFNEALSAYHEEEWNYKAPQKNAALERAVDSIDIADFPDGSPFHLRTVFLKMRGEMAMRRWQNVVDLWNNNGKNAPPSALRDRMEGYYAGALYHLGRPEEAVDVFYRLGDNNSILWCTSDMIGIDGMTKLYERNPHSTALLYVMQDYINSLGRMNQALQSSRFYSWLMMRPQDEDSDGIRDDILRGCGDFQVLAEKVLKDKKAPCRMAWMTALAYTEQLAGNAGKSAKTLAKASKLDGSDLERENLKRIKLWADVCNMNKSGLGQSQAEQIKSLVDKTALNSDCTLTYLHKGFIPEQFEYDYVATVLVPTMVDCYISRDDLPGVATILNASKNIRYTYGPSYINLLDYRASIEDLKTLLAYRNGTAKEDNLKKTFVPQLDLNMLNDMTGTRLLRCGRFEEAIPYLEAVPNAWTQEQGYYAYMTSRDLDDARPFRRNKYPSVRSIPTDRNIKVDYCKSALALLGKIGNAGNTVEKASLTYELANLLFQATPMGALWSISDCQWSAYNKDTTLADYAIGLIDQALEGLTDMESQRKLWFAKASLVKPEWYYKYDDKYSRVLGFGWVKNARVQPEMFMKLSESRASDSDPYEIRHCDVLWSYMRNKF